MARTASKARSTKKLKAKNNVLVVEPRPETKKIKKTKDGWEMSARDALLVNFVVSEI